MKQGSLETAVCMSRAETKQYKPVVLESQVTLKDNTCELHIHFTRKRLRTEEMARSGKVLALQAGGP